MSRLFLVDDDAGLRSLLRVILEGADHEVVLEAATEDEAIEKTEEAVRLGVQVMLLDGDLTSRGGGARVAKHYEEHLGEEMKILSLSSVRRKYGHMHLTKTGSLAVSELLGAIEILSRRAN